MQRRVFINQLSIAGSLITISGLAGCMTNSGDSSASTNKINNEFKPDLDIKLTASSYTSQILPGPATKTYSYRYNLISGNNKAVQSIESSYLGPIIRVNTGDKVRIRFTNEIKRESVVHWHGLHLPPEMDGHPRYAINPGEEFIYEFEVVDRAGTYWFHPHPDKLTGPQVYQGLAGMFLVSDPEEDNLNLPQGKYDQPLIIQDRTFSEDNHLVYPEDPMSLMNGFLGDQILVNGKLPQKMEVDKATYRFRLLNGSNSRIYKLAWSNGIPITVIGTDGGLLEQPEKLPYLMLAPGERYDIWVDFSELPETETISLKSLNFNAGMMMMQRMGMMRDGMMGRQGMMHDQTTLPNGSEFEILSFEVTSQRGEQKNLPFKLSTIEVYDSAKAINSNNPREFNFFMEQMQWTINGETFEMEEAAEWEKVRLNTKEVWQFINGDAQMGMMGNQGMMGQRGRGMMGDENNEVSGPMRSMQMPHPVHIHGLQFQILERNTDNMDPAIWDSIKDGFVDGGWQDTFLLMPDMKVKIMLEFRDFEGLYAYHCHNLEHEDMGMMRNYRVIS